MTTDFPQLHPTRDFIPPPTARLSRAWVAFAAVSLAAGAGYATWTLSGSAPDPEPAAPSALAALAAQPGAEAADEPATHPTGSDGVEAEAAIETNELPAAGDERKGIVLPSTNGAYFVQVSSYKDATVAKDEADDLVGRGLPAETVAETSWSKVRVGPYATRAEAEKARFQLDVTKRRDAYVLPRSNGKFHVQVGSFASPKDAEPLAERLKARGHVTKISRVKMGDTRWHCVRIGPFDSYEEATGYLDLVDVHGSKARVIPFEPIEN